VSPVSPEAIETLKQAPSESGILEVIRKRWSPRAYSDKPVSAHDLKLLFEAARWAPSSNNEQPWRFLVGRRGDGAYEKISDSLVEFNKTWAKNAPVLMLSVAKKTFANGKPNHHAWHDTGAATAFLSLQAVALGLHTHSMAGFEPETARAFFAIPSDYEPCAVTAIGYFGEPSKLPDSLRQKEEAPRERKPLNAFVWSDWEKSAKF
jgi:nitroreductase